MKTTQKYLTTFTLGAIGFSTAIGFSPLGTTANAQVLGSYTFGTTTTNQTTTASSVNSLTTFNNFSAGSGLNNIAFVAGSGTNNRAYTATGWTTNTSIDSNDYFQFALQATSGNRVTLSSVGFRALGDTSGTTGPASLQLAYALGATPSTFTNVGSVQNTTGSWTNYSVSLSSVPTLTQATSLITFRLYGYSSGNNNGSLSVDDVTVNGTVEPVPEPTTILGGMAALGIGGAIQRKRQKARKTVEAKA